MLGGRAKGPGPGPAVGGMGGAGVGGSLIRCHAAERVSGFEHAARIHTDNEYVRERGRDSDLYRTLSTVTPTSTAVIDPVIGHENGNLLDHSWFWISFILHTSTPHHINEPR